MKAKAIDYISSMFTQKNMPKRTVMAIISVVLMGFGVALFSLSNMGVDPYTSMNMTIASAIHMTFGLWQMFVNIAIIIFVVAVAHRGLVGVGTIFNMIGVGFVCDFFKSIIAPAITRHSLLIDLILMSLGVIFLSFAASLFFTANIGVGAYDALGFMLENKTKISYKWCRVITDFLVIAVAFIVGGMSNIGIGTVVTAFFMGPLVNLFNVKISEKLLMIDYTKYGKNFLDVFSLSK